MGQFVVDVDPPIARPDHARLDGHVTSTEPAPVSLGLFKTLTEVLLSFITNHCTPPSCQAIETCRY